MVTQHSQTVLYKKNPLHLACGMIVKWQHDSYVTALYPTSCSRSLNVYKNLKNALCSPTREHSGSTVSSTWLLCRLMFLMETRSTLEVSMAVDNSSGKEQSQQAEAAGAGHVRPHAVSQLHYGTEAHGWQHLQVSRRKDLHFKCMTTIYKAVLLML